jgi:uncharacterized protein (DUF302 family)
MSSGQAPVSQAEYYVWKIGQFPVEGIMRKLTLFLIAPFIGIWLCSAAANAASDGVVVKPSAFSVKETMDRLEAVLRAKKFRIHARIDHGETVTAEAELLIYGTPKISTPLISANILAGLNFPMRTLVYKDNEGQVFLVYDHPGYIARRHEIEGHDRLVGAISRILTNLTDQAIKDK